MKTIRGDSFIWCVILPVMTLYLNLTLNLNISSKLIYRYVGPFVTVILGKNSVLIKGRRSV